MQTILGEKHFCEGLSMRRCLSFQEKLLRSIFKALALWADAFYKLKCPSVRVSESLGKSNEKKWSQIWIFFVWKFSKITHCESGEGIWLQGEAALEAHGFRDAEPHPVILANAKNNYEIFSKKLRLCNFTNLSPTDLCLPSTAW